MRCDGGDAGPPPRWENAVSALLVNLLLSAAASWEVQHTNVAKGSLGFVQDVLSGLMKEFDT